MAPVEETIHGNTFWLPTRETTRRREALAAPLYNELRPELAAGALSSSWSVTEET